MYLRVMYIARQPYQIALPMMGLISSSVHKWTFSRILQHTEKDIHVCQFDNIRVRGILIETMSHVLQSQQTYSRFEQSHAYVHASHI